MSGHRKLRLARNVYQLLNIEWRCDNTHPVACHAHASQMPDYVARRPWSLQVSTNSSLQDECEKQPWLWTCIACALSMPRVGSMPHGVWCECVCARIFLQSLVPAPGISVVVPLCFVCCHGCDKTVGPLFVISKFQGAKNKTTFWPRRPGRFDEGVQSSPFQS